MSAVIRWEEPPPRTPGQQRLDSAAIAAELKARPGTWGLINVGGRDTGLVTQICRGRISAFRPAGSFDAIRRSVEGVPHVYARYVGGAS